MLTVVEEVVRAAVRWLRLGVEVTGALVVGIGVVLALWVFVRSAISHRPPSFNSIRLVLAQHLALALEFQLASDILATTIAPTWDQIGQLAAVAVIRTALNFFLGQEIKEEQKTAERNESAVEGGGNDRCRPPAERPPTS